MTEQKGHLELVPPNTEAILAEYNVMRKQMVFDPIGKPYDDNNPDESRDENHRRVLLLDGNRIGTVRIDRDVRDAFVMATTLNWLDPRPGHRKMGSEDRDIPTGGNIG